MAQLAENNLLRFVGAQDPVFEQVCSELDVGFKATHWMWFVFPQLQGLGTSAMVMRYAIADLNEAKAYLAHPVSRRYLVCRANRRVKYSATSTQ